MPELGVFALGEAALAEQSLGTATVVTPTAPPAVNSQIEFRAETTTTFPLASGYTTGYRIKLSSPATLQKLGFIANVNATISGNLKIRDESGTVLGTASFSSYAVTGVGPHYFSLSSPVTLSAGTVYWITVHQSSGSSVGYTIDNAIGEHFNSVVGTVPITAWSEDYSSTYIAGDADPR